MLGNHFGISIRISFDNMIWKPHFSYNWGKATVGSLDLETYDNKDMNKDYSFDFYWLCFLLDVNLNIDLPPQEKTKQ